MKRSGFWLRRKLQRPVTAVKRIVAGQFVARAWTGLADETFGAAHG